MKDSLKKYTQFSPLLVTGFILFGMGLIIWFGILPFQKFITEKADGIQEYYATRENREQQMNKLPDLQGQFERIGAEEDILAILLSEKNVVDFVQTLERLAQETGVQVLIRSKTGDIIEEKKAVKAPTKKAVPADAGEDDAVSKKDILSLLESVPFDRYLHVEVVVKGEYRTIVTFLHKMETLPLALDVVGMSMKVRDDESEVTRPDNPGRNPFLILSEGVTSDVPTQEDPVEVAPGNLEASFDTLVYLDN